MDTRNLIRNLLSVPASPGSVALDELVDELRRRAGLSDEQARAAGDVVSEWVRDAEKRRKLTAAVVATTPSVVTGG